MRLLRVFTIGLMALGALPISAQTPPAISHSRIACVRAETRPLLEATVQTEGIPRVYYRLLGSEAWCYVDGDRYEDEAIFVLPEFAEGTVIEYFFITYTEQRITGRTSITFQAAVTRDCQTVVARHTGAIVPECGGAGAIPWAFEPTFASQNVEVSPSSPE